MFKSYPNPINLSNHNKKKMSPLDHDQLSLDIDRRPDIITYATRDYDKFNANKYNRDVDEHLIKKLIDSMQKIGFDDATPIIVNSALEILDGHHRYYAAKHLNIECIYKVNDKFDLQTYIMKENARKNWPTLQQIKFYTTHGNNPDSYKFLFYLHEKYNIRLDVILEIATGGRNAEIGRKLKSGEWKLDRKNELENFCIKFFEIMKLLKKLNIPFLPKFLSRNCAPAWNKLFLHPQFELSRLIYQLECYKDQLHPGTSGKTHLKNICHLYNYKRRNCINHESIKWSVKKEHN